MSMIDEDATTRERRGRQLGVVLLKEEIMPEDSMMVALIHWRIKPEPEAIEAFLDHWRRRNTIEDRSGLIGEFLSGSLSIKDYPDITWHLDESSLGNFKSYVTIGLWDSAEAFKKQVANYFNDDNPLLDFEKYRRRRVFFEPRAWRIGKSPLPKLDSFGVF